jgi:hypothetical protein
MGQACRRGKELTCWPQATNLRISRKLGSKLHDSTNEAELVPALHHARLDKLLVGIKELLFFVERFVPVTLQCGRYVQYSIGGSCVIFAVVVQRKVGVFSGRQAGQDEKIRVGECRQLKFKRGQ